VPNPVFDGWYADPELHCFEGRFYIYPTYSAEYEEQAFFEVWSSEDLLDWRNEGRILDFDDVPWSTKRAAWAPTICAHEGTYFFYFSAGDGAGLGVATSKSPTGPFVDALGRPLISEYHHGAQPIDAHVFQDDDGRNYLYWGGWRHAVMAELGADMVSLASEVTEITPDDYVEGPFMIKRHGTYYFMWSEGSWGDQSYSVAYARSDSPWGPFHREAKILQSDPTVGTSAGHHSVLQVPGTDDWVLAYHRRPTTETARDHRVVCLESLTFQSDGSIAPVVLTHAGVTLRSIQAQE
jgi:beta-xylosidase